MAERTIRLEQRIGNAKREMDFAERDYLKEQSEANYQRMRAAHAELMRLKAIQARIKGTGGLTGEKPHPKAQPENPIAALIPEEWGALGPDLTLYAKEVVYQLRRDDIARYGCAAYAYPDCIWHAITKNGDVQQYSMSIREGLAVTRLLFEMGGDAGNSE